MMSGTLTEDSLPPHKTLVKLDMGPISSVTGYAGQSAWEKEPDGSVRILQGDELKEARSDAGFSIDDFDPLSSSADATVALRKVRDPATGDYLIDVTPKNGSLQTLAINPTTFFTDRVEAHHSGMVAEMDIKSYKLVQGLEIPSVVEISYQGIPITITTTLQSAKRGLTFSNDVFEAPNSHHDIEILGQDGSSSVTIPFKNPHSEIVLEAKINGQPIDLLLDTGAAKTFITTNGAKKLGLKTAGEIMALGYGGSSAVQISDPTTVEISNAVRMPGQSLYIMSDEKTGQALSEKANADGAIGYDLISKVIVTINYPAHTITFTDPKAYVPSSDPTVVSVPIRLDQDIPTVTAAVDSKAKGQFLYDTGDNSGLAAYNKYAADNKLPSDPSMPGADNEQAQGVGGPISVVTTGGHSFTIGSLTLKPVPLSVFQGAGISKVSESAGGFGNVLLKDYIVTIDYPHTTLSFKLADAAPVADAGPAVKPSDDKAAPGPKPVDDTAQIPIPAPNQPATPPVTPANPGPTVAPLPAHPTLSDILTRHLAALGGEQALDNIKNTRVVATLETGGTTGTITTLFSAPDKEFEEDILGALDVTQGYDGVVAWKKDSNGAVRELGGDELKDLRNQLYYDTNAYVLQGRMKGRETLVPGTEPGTGNYIILAQPAGGKPMKIYIDPNSFLIARDEQTEDDQTVVTSFGSYERVDGVMFPTKQHVTNGNTRYDADVTVNKIENNVVVAGNPFSEPALAATAGFIKPGAHEATTDLIPEYGELALECAINGHPVTLFLDSGAAGIALSQDVVKRLNLKEQGYLQANGYGGSTDFRPVRLSTFEVKNCVSISNDTAVAVDLPDSFQEMADRPVSGFVGYDLLSRFVVQIDYKTRKIKFIDPSTFKPGPEFGTELPLDLDNDVPQIPAKLDGLPVAKYLVDTGDVAGLRLYGPYVQSNGLRNIYKNGVQTVGGGIGGLSYSWRTRVHSLTVGGMTLKDVPTDFSLDTKGGGSIIEAGALGGTVLAHFIVTLS
jgi:predicted aspartyl protease